MKTEVYVDFKKLCEFVTHNNWGEFHFVGEETVCMSLDGHSHKDLLKEFLPIVLEKVGITPTDENTIVKNDLTEIMVFSTIRN